MARVASALGRHRASTDGRSRGLRQAPAVGCYLGKLEQANVLARTLLGTKERARDVLKLQGGRAKH